MIFCSKRRKELSSQNPALTTSEVSVILGDEWTNMSEVSLLFFFYFKRNKF